MRKHSIFRIGLAGAFALLLCHCANVSTAPDDRAQSAKQFATVPGKGVVYLYRPGRAVGAAIQHQVKINGRDAGGTGPGTFFRWELEPGPYTFSSFTQESSATIEVNVEAGKLYFIEQNAHIGLTQGGRVTIREVSAATGQSAVSNSRLLVSSYVPGR